MPIIAEASPQNLVLVPGASIRINIVIDQRTGWEKYLVPIAKFSIPCNFTVTFPCIDRCIYRCERLTSLTMAEMPVKRPEFTP